MDKQRQHSNKDKSKKNTDTDKSPSFLADVKAIKENLKIREILRTVKMNSSMRIKAPRGSKVMQNKDFNDNEDFEEVSIEDECASEPPCATNPNVITDPPQDTTKEESSQNCIKIEDTDVDVVSSDPNPAIQEKVAEEAKLHVEATTVHKSNSFSESSTTMSQIEKGNDINTSSNTLLASNDLAEIKSRDRKLSLDQTMLTRREGLSQSELDLHSIGKSPLERKSSFFRKKMGSFFKNTSEIFKRQSYGSKSPTVQRRGSMSVSLQSLNEKTTYNEDCSPYALQTNQEVGSVSSLHSSVATGHSNSSLSQVGLAPETEEDSFAGSQPGFTGSQPIEDISSNSLYDICNQESLMNSRAISMSSGLDSVQGKGRRKASRSNRVTWLASEGLMNYFRRQEEKYKDAHVSYSYQDFSTIPENNSYGPILDSKGRRLSYQRAVSGEDPVIPVRYQDTLRRKPHIPENHMANYELSKILAELARPYTPSLSSYELNLSPGAKSFLVWSEKPENLFNYLSGQDLPSIVEARQSAIGELICTEAEYIRYLVTSVQHIFISTLRILKHKGYLEDVDFKKLFLNFVDVINANLQFWQFVLYPMIKEAVESQTPFDSNFMFPGFVHFPQIFHPYEIFVCQQKKALDYLRFLNARNPDFFLYITWCYNQEICHRLQLPDIIAKPMQRLTKYKLMLDRIILYTNCARSRATLGAMEALSATYLLDVNRAMRQREEMDALDELVNSVELFYLDFKDEDLDRAFKKHSIYNLKMPMLFSHLANSRTLVYQADLRFKDSLKEFDARAILLTDIMLICKKQSKSSSVPFKVVRPKYFMSRMTSYQKTGRDNEIISIIYVVLDDFNTAQQCFSLSEPSSKETNPLGNIKTWEVKYREANLSYDYGVWYANNPLADVRDFTSAIEAAIKSGKMTSDGGDLERDARARVAAMLHKKDLTEIYDLSAAMASFDLLSPTSIQQQHSLLRRLIKRSWTEGTARKSRLSSSQTSVSAAASPQEPQPGPSRPDTSVAHVTSPQTPDDDGTSMIVNVASDSESDDEQCDPSRWPMVIVQHPSPCPSQNGRMLNPERGAVALIRSLPDLTLELFRSRTPESNNASTSDMPEVNSHQDQEPLSRLSSPQHAQYLTPDNRGSSYPPSSPTRASLQRGQAVSFSPTHPLEKMARVNSQSPTPGEAGSVTTQPEQNEPSTSRGNQTDDNASARSEEKRRK